MGEGRVARRGPVRRSTPRSTPGERTGDTPQMPQEKPFPPFHQFSRIAPLSRALDGLPAGPSTVERRSTPVRHHFRHPPRPHADERDARRTPVAAGGGGGVRAGVRGGVAGVRRDLAGPAAADRAGGRPGGRRGDGRGDRRPPRLGRRRRGAAAPAGPRGGPARGRADGDRGPARPRPRRLLRRLRPAVRDDRGGLHLRPVRRPPAAVRDAGGQPVRPHAGRPAVRAGAVPPAETTTTRRRGGRPTSRSGACRSAGSGRCWRGSSRNWG